MGEAAAVQLIMLIPRSPRRARRVLLVLPTVLLVGLFAPASASASASAPASAPASASADRRPIMAELASISADLRRYREAATARQRDYLNRFQGRFPPEQGARVQATGAEVERELAALQREVDQALRLSRLGARRDRVELAARQAAVTVDRLLQRAQADEADVSTLLESQLSLFEALSMWQDYVTSKSQLRAIGGRLHSVAGARGQTR